METSAADLPPAAESPGASPEARPPRLLFVATEDWFFCSHFLPMARAARAAGFEVAVAARLRGHGEALAREGLRALPLGGARGSLNPLGLLREIGRLARLFRAERPDIVHLIALRPIVLGGIAARLAGVPWAVYAVTGMGYLAASRRWRFRLLRRVTALVVGRLLDGPRIRFVFENPDDASALGQAAGGGRTLVVGGAGVDPDQFAALPPPAGDPVRIAVVARMLWSKGIDVAVEAWRRLRARGLTVELVLAGAPDPANPRAIPAAQLAAWAAEPGLSWLGPVADVRTLWRDADIALLPSRGGEGLPRSLLEAAACARPLVTTDVPGCRALVRDGVEGHVVPPDDPAALADALERLVRSAELRRAMGAAARRRIGDGFTERQVGAAVAALYRSLVPASGTGG